MLSGGTWLLCSPSLVAAVLLATNTLLFVTTGADVGPATDNYTTYLNILKANTQRYKKISDCS